MAESVFKAAGPLELANRNWLAIGENLREIQVILSVIPTQEVEITRCRKEAVDRNILDIRKGIRDIQKQLDAIATSIKPKA